MSKVDPNSLERNFKQHLSVKERLSEALERYEAEKHLPWHRRSTILTIGQGFPSGATEKWCDDPPDDLPAHETRVSPSSSHPKNRPYERGNPSRDRRLGLFCWGHAA